MKYFKLKEHILDLIFWVFWYVNKINDIKINVMYSKEFNSKNNIFFVLRSLKYVNIESNKMCYFKALTRSDFVEVMKNLDLKCYG
ncbi:uncharacterized protein T551_01004 [Pneumocystis jirovecii RU7]|uniref:Uncharacterized protein n=1 Tax=Pneumocystis jirovecii (strain RU7) TaxID=1408657 RepID=A0A0W4ZTM5_PNEJ7|nr:uncharacterized protein T551_01004 [Pneumocystis jirovecii RU7]KTW31743.1 hypothetical protein T551_01004 [Pneumocystis jirovecii RU7]